MQSKSWSLCILAVSAWRLSNDAIDLIHTQLLCSYAINMRVSVYVAMRRRRRLATTVPTVVAWERWRRVATYIGTRMFIA